VSINGQNNTGNTPFHFACENGHIKLAKWLSENGANLWV
jgi:ankyrin repeat protein